MENSNEKEDMRALIMVFVIWLLLWCVDNRQYFFEYLPHHSDYEIVAAYKAFNGDMRDNIIRDTNCGWMTGCVLDINAHNRIFSAHSLRSKANLVDSILKQCLHLGCTLVLIVGTDRTH